MLLGKEIKLRIKSKLSHSVFKAVVLTDKGKPSERGRRKATDLKAIEVDVAYGGWVAEIG